MKRVLQQKPRPDTPASRQQGRDLIRKCRMIPENLKYTEWYSSGGWWWENVFDSGKKHPNCVFGSLGCGIPVVCN